MATTTIRQEFCFGKLRYICPSCGESNLRRQDHDVVTCGTCARVFTVTPETAAKIPN